MTLIEIANLKHPNGPTSGSIPSGFDGRTHYAEVLTALIPAVGILAFAATLLLAISRSVS